MNRNKETTTVLIIDDSQFIINSVTRMILNYHERAILCLSALSGEKGLSLFETQDVDLVLLDYEMPNMDGIQVLRKIREKDTDTPVIVMTAQMEEEYETMAFSNGATDFIHKPFSEKVITARIEHQLSYANMQKQMRKEIEHHKELAEKRLKQNYEILSETIKALAKTIDKKDPYTRGHSERVAFYSRCLAKCCGISDENELNNIYYAGLLHDIGKIGIPATIIRKSTKLTDEEYARIKEHTTIGYEILKKVKSNPLLGLGAHYHHEHYDGTGYPQKLKGDEIPFVARIICVADAYDAMTSHRSYHDTMPQEMVKKQLKEGLGTQFDPQICRIMLNLIDMDVNYLMKQLDTDDYDDDTDEN